MRGSLRGPLDIVSSAGGDVCESRLKCCEFSVVLITRLRMAREKSFVRAFTKQLLGE